MGFVGSTAAMMASIKINKRTRISTFEKIKDFKKSKKREFFFPNKETKKYLKEISNKIKRVSLKKFWELQLRWLLFTFS
ncbi:MAG: hypothetical protein ACI9JT_000073 [Polaribacter sp.]|jgi:hypothetical protein